MPFPVKPSAKFFTKPDNLVPGLGTTVTDDGHVFGYIALFEARLIGSGRKNTRPPRSKSGYAYANAYQTVCDDGSTVRTGVIAGDGGHHNLGGFKPTQEAYADTKHQVARVTYGEDNHGIWFSGALCPEVDEATVAKVRGSGVSGHWERPAAGRPHELLGSVLVNVPGFAQAADHRIVASASFTPTGGITIGPSVVDDNDNAQAQSVSGRGIITAGASITAAGSLLVPVSGVLAALGTPTVDGRQVNAVQYDRLPLPLWYSSDNCMGHWGAKLVGTVNEITVDGSLVRYSGFVEEELMASEEVGFVAALDILGISMDGYPDIDSEIIYEYDEYGWPTLSIFELYSITGATLLLDPAFRETIGAVVGADELPAPEDVAPAATEDSAIAASAGVPEVTTIKLPIRWH